VNALAQRRVRYVVTIRATHGVWMVLRERIRTTAWRAFTRVLIEGSSQRWYLPETILGRRRSMRYYQFTTGPVRHPPESTWQFITNLPGKIEHSVGNTRGLRNWIEHGCKRAHHELRRTDTPQVVQRLLPLLEDASADDAQPPAPAIDT